MATRYAAELQLLHKRILDGEIEEARSKTVELLSEAKSNSVGVPRSILTDEVRPERVDLKTGTVKAGKLNRSGGGVGGRHRRHCARARASQEAQELFLALAALSNQPKDQERRPKGWRDLHENVMILQPVIDRMKEVGLPFPGDLIHLAAAELRVRPQAAQHSVKYFVKPFLRLIENGLLPLPQVASAR